MRILANRFFSMLLILLSTSHLLAQEQVLAIKAGTILTLEGEPIRNGIVLLQNGKISALGSDVNIPPDSKIIDASKQVVMPGLVYAGPFSVMRGQSNEQSSEMTPSFRVATAINPEDKHLKRLSQTGVTSVHIAPGPFNLIAGLGAVIKPTGKTAQEMIIKEDASLWITLGASSTYGNRAPRRSPPTSFYYRRPTTRMAVAYMLRKQFFDVQRYQADSPDTVNKDLEIIKKAMDSQIPIFMSAKRSTDLRMALTLAQEYDLDITLFGGTEGFQLVQQIAERNIPVVLEPHFELNAPSYRIEGGNLRWDNATTLSKAGVPVALASFYGVEQADLFTVALFAVRHGMDHDLALRAITLTPAEILGVADRVGSLAPGKDADLLVLSGDPLQSTSRIERVLINGKTIFQVD